MTTIGPTHIIIPEIILIVLIWDGVVIEGITATTTNIGVTISQVVITKIATTVISEAINVVIPVNAETTAGMVTMDANGDDKLIVRTGGKWAGQIYNLTSCQKNRVCGDSPQTLFL